MINLDEYLAGMRDADEGKPHQAGRSHDYDRGYAVQYELDQVMDAMTKGQCDD